MQSMEFTAEDKKMRLTPLQAAMLKKIATDEMTCVNGAEPDKSRFARLLRTSVLHPIYLGRTGPSIKHHTHNALFV